MALQLEQLIGFGHSGSSVFLDRADNTILKNGDNRLIIQAYKQMRFVSNDRVCAPKITNIASGCTTTVRMEYVEGINPLESPLHDFYVHAISDWVLHNLRNGHVVEYPGSIFRAKLKQLASVLDSSLHTYLDNLEDHFRNGATLTLGRTHGDLTFCNMIASGDTLYLIDFLDLFVDAVEMDMAKLRQDTADHWITLFTDIPMERLNIADALLDQRFCEHDRLGSYRRHIDAFRMLNLLRAFPYATNSSVRDHILERLECLLSC